MRSKKGDARAIVMLLFGLVAIILIWVQIRQAEPKPPPEISRLAGKRIAVFDSTYINLPFQFLIRMSNRLWHLSALTADTVLLPIQPDQSIESRILWLLSAKRVEKSDTLAKCRIGVWAQAEGTAKSSAVNYLAEQISEHERGKVRARILQPVSGPAHAVLKGAYFVMALPPSGGVLMPVQIVALLPRNDLFYIIKIETTEKDYADLRNELEGIVRRFYPLPALVD